MTHEHAQHEHSHHVTPPKVYWIVYGFLVVGMALTVLAARYDLGPLNNLIAMVIAITKATLVVLFFMQVKYGTRLIWLWAALGFIWFLLLFITLQDYLSRGWIRVPGWS